MIDWGDRGRRSIDLLFTIYDFGAGIFVNRLDSEAQKAYNYAGFYRFESNEKSKGVVIFAVILRRGVPEHQVCYKYRPEFENFSQNQSPLH